MSPALQKLYILFNLEYVLATSLALQKFNILFNLDSLLAMYPALQKFNILFNLESLLDDPVLAHVVARAAALHHRSHQA